MLLEIEVNRLKLKICNDWNLWIEKYNKLLYLGYTTNSYEPTVYTYINVLGQNRYKMKNGTFFSI